ncbi:MAG: hypothetical protein OXC40_02095 [Proteobacteria bacterium]|nr:hypothetical protein [Pseudomonadota bacterium]
MLLRLLTQTCFVTLLINSLSGCGSQKLWQKSQQPLELSAFIDQGYLLKAAVEKQDNHLFFEVCLFAEQTLLNQHNIVGQNCVPALVTSVGQTAYFDRHQLLSLHQEQKQTFLALLNSYEDLERYKSQQQPMEMATIGAASGLSVLPGMMIMYGSYHLAHHSKNISHHLLRTMSRKFYLSTMVLGGIIACLLPDVILVYSADKINQKYLSKLNHFLNHDVDSSLTSKMNQDKSQNLKTIIYHWESLTSLAESSQEDATVVNSVTNTLRELGYYLNSLPLEAKAAGDIRQYCVPNPKDFKPLCTDL